MIEGWGYLNEHNDRWVDPLIEIESMRVMGGSVNDGG